VLVSGPGGNDTLHCHTALASWTSWTPRWAGRRFTEPWSQVGHDDAPLQDYSLKGDSLLEVFGLQSHLLLLFAIAKFI
jgi:hypothetical protein